MIRGKAVEVIGFWASAYEDRPIETTRDVTNGRLVRRGRANVTHVVADPALDSEKDFSLRSLRRNDKEH